VKEFGVQKIDKRLRREGKKHEATLFGLTPLRIILTCRVDEEAFKKRVLVGWIHEVVDTVWSSLSEEQKLRWAEAFRDVYMNPTEYFKNGLLEPDDLELWIY
jgi:hypothetical protein